MIRLAAGDWTAGVRPELGGAVVFLRKGDLDVLRPTAEGAVDPLETACFPLTPYANRIAGARFRFRGREVSIPTLAAFTPHALHGDGWLKPWTVERASSDRVVLALDGGGDDHWPWAYRARQSLALSDEGLEIVLEMENRSGDEMPGGLGLHPYLPRPAGARLTAATTGVWTGADIVPDRLAASAGIADWTGQAVDAAAAAVSLIDNAYEGWNGVAELADDGGVTRISSDADRLHVYAPQGQGFVCLEPVTHRPDVFNQAEPGEGGFRVLAPGGRMTLRMTVGRTAA
ncbi:aldose 1-epimerase [Brevundimonas sp. VNH65]|uniref:aldose 1-epimerase n=1 Tax=Brevundimonas sp. VNH65 TaxID=3400917 RepID=UPI003C05EA20